MIDWKALKTGKYAINVRVEDLVMIRKVVMATPESAPGRKESLRVLGKLIGVVRRAEHRAVNERAKWERRREEPRMFVGDTAENSGAMAVLGLSEPLSIEKIKSAYRAKALQLHPDRGGDAVEFIEATIAYKRLLRACS